MADIFSNSGNLVLTAFFFQPLLPISIPIALGGIIFSYWVNKVISFLVKFLKYLLLRRVKRPEELSGFMAIFFANLVPWIAFLWALSMALFYRNIFRDVFSR
jgi:hypothetical protein